MYCNKYSVVYIQPKGDGTQLIETGDKLGDMTSELRPSKIINEFACGGQKNYKHRLGDTVPGARQIVCKI